MIWFKLCAVFIVILIVSLAAFGFWAHFTVIDWRIKALVKQECLLP